MGSRPADGVAGARRRAGAALGAAADDEQQHEHEYEQQVRTRAAARTAAAAGSASSATTRTASLTTRAASRGGQPQPAAGSKRGGSPGGSRAGKTARAAPDADGWPRLVWAGTGRVRAARLADSTPAWAAADWPRLRRRLRTEGYLFLRGVLAREDVLEVPSLAAPVVT